jgi:hypothetical protein
MPGITRNELSPVYLHASQRVLEDPSPPVIFDDLQMVEGLSRRFRQVRREVPQAFRHARFGLVEIPAGDTFYSASGRLNRVEKSAVDVLHWWQQNRYSPVVPSGEIMLDGYYADGIFHPGSTWSMFDFASEYAHSSLTEALSSTLSTLNSQRKKGAPGVNLRGLACDEEYAGHLAAMTQRWVDDSKFLQPFGSTKLGLRPELVFANSEYDSTAPSLGRPLSQSGVLDFGVATKTPTLKRKAWADTLADVSERALSNGFDLITFLKESPEIAKIPLVLLALGKRLKSGKAISNWKSFASFMGNSWLTYAFGISPTVMDIESILQAVKNVSMGKTAIPVSTKMDIQGPRQALGYDINLPGNTVYSGKPPFDRGGNQWFSSTSVFPALADKKLHYALVHAIVPRSYWRVKAYVPVSVMSELRHGSDRLAGLLDYKPFTDLASWADALWEMLPYSWLVDYFTNMSQLVSLAGRQSKYWNDLRDAGQYSVSAFDGYEWLTSLYRMRLDSQKGEGFIFDTHVHSWARARFGVRNFVRWYGFNHMNPRLSVSFDITRGQAANIVALLAKFAR